MSCENFEIDTKGTCLLCYSNSAPPGNLAGAPLAFKMLLRYLKIDLKKLGHFSSAFVPFPNSLNAENISVNLCQYCSSVTTDFLQLFQDFERIRLMLDNCVWKLHRAMKEGENDGVRVREYRNRVGPVSGDWTRPEDVLHSSIADILRKEAMGKCALKLKLVHSTPRILIENELSPKTQKTMPSTVCRNSGSEKKENLNLVNIIKSDIPIPSSSTLAGVDFDDWEYADDIDANPSLQMLDPLGICNPVLDESKSVEFGTGTQQPQAYKDEVKNRKSLNDCAKISDNNRYNHKCPHCYKAYPTSTNLKTHLMMIHTFLHFSNRLPPGTTEQQLQSSIQAILSKTRQVTNPVNGILLVGCTLCHSSFRTAYELQRHVLWMHFDVLVTNYLSQSNDVISFQQSNVLLKKENTNDTQFALNIFDDDSDPECNSLLTEDPLELELDSDPPQDMQLEQPIPHHHAANPSTVIVHKDNPAGGGSSSSISTLRKTIIRNNRKHSLTGEHECHHCGKVFSNLSSLQFHTNEFHSGVRKHYLCIHCSKVFTRQSALRMHGAVEHTFTIFNNRFHPGTTEVEFKKVVKKVMAQIKNFVVTEGGVVTEKAGCPFCEKAFMSPKKNMNALKAHILQYHLDDIVYRINKKREKLEGRG